MGVFKLALNASFAFLAFVFVVVGVACANLSAQYLKMFAFFSQLLISNLLLKEHVVSISQELYRNWVIDLSKA